MAEWDFDEISRKLKEREGRSKLVEQARVAMKNGGDAAVEKWAREYGVELASPVRAARAKLSASAINALRGLAGLEPKTSARASLCDGAKALVRAAAAEVMGKGSVVDRMIAQGLLDTIVTEAMIESEKGEAASRAEEARRTRERVEARLGPELRARAEREATEIARAAAPLAPARRKILGGRF